MTWHWGDRTSKVETQNFGTDIRIVALRTTSLSPSDHEPTWLLQDATFEKMGVIMAENNGRLLAMYDELSAFLNKIKLYGNRGLSDSHELANCITLTLGLGRLVCTNHPYCFACYSIACVQMLYVKY